MDGKQKRENRKFRKNKAKSERAWTNFSISWKSYNWKLRSLLLIHNQNFDSFYLRPSREGCHCRQRLWCLFDRYSLTMHWKFSDLSYQCNYQNRTHQRQKICSIYTPPLPKFPTKHGVFLNFTWSYCSERNLTNTGAKAFILFPLYYVYYGHRY